MNRRFAGFLAFILFIILLVVLISHGHKKPSQSNTPTPVVKTLPDYANSTAAVSLTTDGIVNGDELHRSIRITVAQDRRVVDVIQGYSGQVIDSHSFYNTNASYYVFLTALRNAGFTAKVKNSKAPADERGQCPLGFRYVFVLNDQGDDLSRLWSSSCATGNWAGRLETVQTLFKDQVPNYSTLTGSVNLEATQ